ncbi:hypothetical protein [Aeromonas rivipollensis]|uniref:hypothetical protein n=1 Tax=Aeromonas rivipollensis TaxID=948519 RepID=UPI0039895B1E
MQQHLIESPFEEGDPLFQRQECPPRCTVFKVNLNSKLKSITQTPTPSLLPSLNGLTLATLTTTALMAAQKNRTNLAIPLRNSIWIPFLAFVFTAN